MIAWIGSPARSVGRSGLYDRKRRATPSGDPSHATLRVARSDPTVSVAALDHRTTMAIAPLLAVGALWAIMDAPKVHNSL